MNLKKLFGKWDQIEGIPFNFSGLWRNELGSEMTILVDERGRVTGSYSPYSDTGVRSSHALAGFCNGDLIGFTVDFERGHMICSWTGHALKENGEESIQTQWNLVKSLEGDDFAIESWGATHCGSNKFKRVG